MPSRSPAAGCCASIAIEAIVSAAAMSNAADVRCVISRQPPGAIIARVIGPRQGKRWKEHFVKTVPSPRRSLTIVLLALSLTAASPAARPEDIGMSSERLQRITDVVKTYID